MGFIIWYSVEVGEDKEAGPLGGVAGAAAGAAAAMAGIAGLPLKVSNDVKSGQYIVDAEIATSQVIGASIGTFEITLFDLPEKVGDLLVKEAGTALAAGKPLKAEIRLGYFDEAFSFPRPGPVMTGAVERVESSVDAGGRLVTRLRGFERTGWRLRKLGNFYVGMPGPVSAVEFVRWICKKSKVGIGTLDGLETGLRNFTLTGLDGVQGLGELAQRSDVPLVIADDEVVLGKAVGSVATGVKLSPADSIISCDPQMLPRDTKAAAPNGGTTASVATAYRLKVLGQPRLKLGQTVELDIKPRPPGTLRIESLSHHFSSREGYTSELLAVVAEAGKVRPETGAAAVVARLHDVVEQSAEKRRAIDVGEVSAVKPAGEGKHLATLNYGQSVPAAAIAPSVDTPIDPGTQLHDKPVASPFAFDRCGLLVPVYPKMRALLAHHRHEANDAVVTGFLFGENPRMTPPEGKVGDWWLCLPTQLGPDGLPAGKAANDLTDASGMRVVQAKGLHIQVGEALAATVGSRPSPPSDASVVIEHQSGTTITIDATGKVEVLTRGKDITLSNGLVSVGLSGPSVGVK